MKGGLIIVSFFVAGILLGRYIDSLSFILESSVTMYVLYCLMFTVGLGIGCDKKALNALRNQDLKVILLPIGTILGTLGGALLVSPLITGIPLQDVLAASAGFGYYSLSSILLTEYRGVEIGTIALMTNLTREILVILAAPFLVKVFGKLSIVSAAGVSSYDVTLPIITKFSGKDVVMISVFHGFVLELTVPVLITFLAGL